MRQIHKRQWLCAILTIVLLLQPIQGEAAASEEQRYSTEILAAAAASVGESLDGFLDSEALSAGDSVSDWIALAMGRTGLSKQGEQYLNKLAAYVTERYAERGGLDYARATEWQRISLTILALGGDPTAFGTDTAGAPIDLIAEGTYGWNRTESFDNQGLNAWIFALITLDAADCPVPEDARFTREDMIKKILDSQEQDGSFGLMAGSSSLDITAMALQALSAHRDSEVRGEDGTDVEEAIDRGVNYLSEKQAATGSFGESGETTAQVIITLCSLGIDPKTDPRFCKEGGSAVDGLLLFRLPSGMYCHQLGDGENLMATEHAARAWIAIERFEDGKSRLYDFRQAEAVSAEAEKPQSARLWTGAVLVIGLMAVAAVCGLIIGKGKKKRDA